MTPHRGPVFVDFPLDVIFDPTSGAGCPNGRRPDEASIPIPLTSPPPRHSSPARNAPRSSWAATCTGTARGTRSRASPRRCGCRAGSTASAAAACPRTTSSRSPRTRALLKSEADLVVVIGTPLDFRLGVRSLRRRPGHSHLSTRPRVEPRTSPPRRHRPATSPRSSTAWPTWSGSTAADHEPWIARVRDAERAAAEPSGRLLEADGDPIKPTRVYGELGKRLARDAVVICDGGDFVSYAGQVRRGVRRPGAGSTPVPYGCLGNGPRLRDRRRGSRVPTRQVVLMLGDGAAGFSLMDVDTLVRHDLPVVMVVGNNGMWGLEKHPMQRDLRLRRGVRSPAGLSLRRGRHRARRRRRDRELAGRGRPRARPRVRRGRAVPRQRADRPEPTSTPGRPTSAEPAAGSQLCGAAPSRRNSAVVGRRGRMTLCAAAAAIEPPSSVGGFVEEALDVDQTRVTLPAATRPRPSDTETVKMRRRPSTFSSVASAFTLPPMPVGARWSSWTRMPTDVSP